MDGLASLTQLFHIGPKKNRKTYVEFDIKPYDDPVRIKTDIDSELEILFGDSEVSISKNDECPVDELNTLVSVTKGEDTKFVAGFGWYHSDKANCLEPKTEIRDDALDIWSEIVRELKNSYGLYLGRLNPGSKYQNKELKLLREINSLVEFAEGAGMRYYSDSPEALAGFDDFSDDGTLIFRKLPRFNLYYLILDKIYSDKNLYSSPDMFSPHSERKNNALRLELTTGCKWNKCTFCSGYSEIPYHEKTFEEFEAHLNDVLFNLEDYYTRYINKVFIGGGNAISVDTDTLADVLELIGSRVFGLRRISAYARAGAILEKGEDDLELLNRRDLKMIYMGIESGSDKLLKYINKGCTSEEIVEAGKIAKKAGIKLSVMVMPGIGGKRYEEVHQSETARVINEIRPDYLTFMGVNALPGTAYNNRIMRDIARNINRPLTDSETIFQIYNMLADVEPYDGKMGCFSCEIDSVGHNPATFDNTLFDTKGKQGIRRSLIRAASLIGHIYVDLSRSPNHKYRF